ncbi:MAG: D-alanine--D-alanine ligase family protein [Acidobacteriota bacterium]
MKRLRVGVLYGGRSGEHEVSVASAAAVFANLDRSRYEPTAIRIEKDGRWLLADRPPSAASAAEVIDQMRSEAARLRAGRDVILPARPGDESLVLIDRPGRKTDEADAPALITGLSLDVIFPVLHGPFGEDGTVQGLLELANVPYVGCGVLASAVGMDKAMMKTVFRAAGLRVTDWEVVTRHAWERRKDELIAHIEARLPYPLFVKPANMGSSVGVSKAVDRASLEAAIVRALEFDRRVVVEVAVPEAREIEVSVLGNEEPEASVAGEIVPAAEFYDYDAKYVLEGSRTEIPAPIDDELHAEIRRQAVAAFRAIDGAGLARVDFLLSRATGELFVNEINTLPGFTAISMFPKLWSASGLPFPALIDRLITLALERHADRQRTRTSAF